MAVYLRPGFILPTQRAVFLVDCPTSRAKVPATMLTAAAEMATRARLDTWSLAVLCGGRIDYMSSVQSKMMSLWPQSQVYVCLIGNGNDNQSCKRKSKFALVVHFGKHPANVPTTLAALRGKAKSFEGLRLRCLSLDCKHRSAGDQKSAAELAQQAISDPKVAATMDRSEIPPDDDEAKADPDEAMSGGGVRDLPGPSGARWAEAGLHR